MKIAVYKQNGEKKKELTLSESFSLKISEKALTYYINYLRAALRSPIAKAKDRAEVSGGGKKPWRQKGTGNARAGSNRSPLWVGGGVTFGPLSTRNFRKRINSNEKKRVILGVFGDLIRDKKVIILDTLNLDEPKTKKAYDVLNNIKADGKISVIISREDENASMAFRNLAGVKIMTPVMLDMIYVLSSNYLVISEKALNSIEELYTKKRVTKSRMDNEQNEPLSEK